MFGKVENKILVFRVGISVASCAKIVSIKSGMELTAMVRWHISAIIIISITNDADSSHRSSFSIKSGHQCHGISAFRQPTAITAVYVCKYIVLPFLNNDLLKYCFVVFFSSAAYNMCVCVCVSINLSARYNAYRIIPLTSITRTESTTLNTCAHFPRPILLRSTFHSLHSFPCSLSPDCSFSFGGSVD